MLPLRVPPWAPHRRMWRSSCHRQMRTHLRCLNNMQTPESLPSKRTGRTNEDGSLQSNHSGSESPSTISSDLSPEDNPASFAPAAQCHRQVQTAPQLSPTMITSDSPHTDVFNRLYRHGIDQRARQDMRELQARQDEMAQLCTASSRQVRRSVRRFSSSACHVRHLVQSSIQQ